MDDWALLESVEGLEEAPGMARAGVLWELLQGEKEDVCREISAAGTLVHVNGFAKASSAFATRALMEMSNVSVN